MDKKLSSARCVHAVVLLTGAAILALGVLVLAGERAGLVFLVQPHPLFQAMSAEGAVGLLLLGGGLLAAGIGWRRLPAAAGVLVLLGVGFGLVWGHTGLTPGETAALVLSATVLVLWNRADGRGKRVVLAGLGSALLLLSIVSLAGHWTGFMTLFGRPHLLRMPIQATLAFSSLGLTVLLFTPRGSQSPSAYLLHRLPSLVAVAFFIATAVLWQSLTVQEQRDLERTIQVEAEAVRRELTDKSLLPFEELIWTREKWEQFGLPDDMNVPDKGLLYLRNRPSCMALGILHADGRVKWNPKFDDPALLELRLFGTNEHMRQMLGDFGKRQGLTLRRGSGSYRGNGLILIVYSPLPAIEKDHVGVVAGFNIPELIDSILHPNLSPGFAIRIFEDGEEIYRRAAPRRSTKRNGGAARWCASTSKTGGSRSGRRRR